MSDSAKENAVSPPPVENHDPDDPLRPEVEEEDNAPTPPLADPYADTEVQEADNDQPHATKMPGEEPMPAPDDQDDDESVLSEIDEAQFEDFDPNALTIQERPAAEIDPDNLSAIGKFKRKRGEGEDGEKPKKKKKRDRPKKKRRDDDDQFSGGEEIEGKRRRKPIAGGDGEKRDRPRPRAKSPDLMENLTPQERQRRELDRKMDESLKNPNRRRGQKTGIDLEALNDDLIDSMRRKMAASAEGDIEARKAGEPAGRKLKMLPEVVSLLNRNNLRDALVDPENNMMEGVRFFLEPLDDGSLPAYNIQREMFLALQRLPINKDTLAASGIGKVVLFYTKSRKVEDGIKRQAERLLGEWTRPILKRSDDFRKRQVQSREYDPRAVSRANVVQSPAQIKAAERARKLATPNPINRARVDTFLPSYTIAPQNNVSNLNSQYTTQASDLTFKRLKARQQAASARR